MGVMTAIDCKLEVIIGTEERWILQVLESDKSCKEDTDVADVFFFLLSVVQMYPTAAWKDTCSVGSK